MTEAELQLYENMAVGLRMEEDFRRADMVDELVAEVRRLRGVVIDRHAHDPELDEPVEASCELCQAIDAL